MTDTPTQLPTTGLEFVEVICYLAEIRPDGADPDADPDLFTIGGTVTLSVDTDQNLLIVRQGDDPARLTRVQDLSFTIQTSTGALIDSQGRVGFKIPRSDSPGIEPLDYTLSGEVRFTGATTGKRVTFKAIPTQTDGKLNIVDTIGLGTMTAAGVSLIPQRVAALEAQSGGGPGTPSSGAYPVQQVALTGNLAYTLPADAPTDQIVSVVFTQDGVGGRTVTYGGEPVSVDLTAGASTLVEVWPGGRVVYPAGGSPSSFVVTAGPVTLPIADEGETFFYRLTDETTVDGVTFPAGRYGFEYTAGGWVWWELAAATALAGTTTTTTTAATTTTTTTEATTTTTTTAATTTTTTTAPGFPSTLPGLVAWFDASDAATITTGATFTWLDKSGNANHVAQGTAAKQPSTGTATLNGLNVIDFDGTDDALSKASITLAQPLTIAVVQKLDSVGAGNQVSVSLSNVYAAFNRGSTSKWALYAPTPYLEAATPAPDTAAHQFTSIINSTSSVLRMDGAAIASGATGTNVPASLTIGGATASAGYWDGPIAEIVIVSGVLSGADLTGLESYLKTKWGTP